MILTDFYSFDKLAEVIGDGIKVSKTRMDCKASTGSYDPLENLRNKKEVLCVYLTPNNTKAGLDGKSVLRMSAKGEHITSILTPSVTSGFAYGDTRHTGDALLFVIKDLKMEDGAIVVGSKVEVFVARGKALYKEQLYHLLCDGELDEEMERLRALAKPE